MLDKFTIHPCDKGNIKTIIDGINDYNLSNVAALADAWAPLDYVMKNENDEEIAGILSGIGYWNGLDIKILWVRDDYRGQGIGSMILKHVETIAIKKGATMAMLDTFSFQAEGFYLKNGYGSIGKINDFPKGYNRIYFSKKLG